MKEFLLKAKSICFNEKENVKATLIFLLLLALNAYSFLGDFIFIRIDGSNHIPFIPYLVIAIITLLLDGLYFFYQYKKGNKHLSWPILIGLGSLTFINTMITGLSINSGIYSVTNIEGNIVSQYIDFSTQVKTVDSFRYIFLLITIFMLLVITPKRVSITGSFTFVIYVFLIVVFIGLIYSLITEFTVYQNLFIWIKQRIVDKNNVCKSFLTNPNNWGLLLTLAIFGSLFLFSVKKHFIYPIFALIFFFFEIFSMCRTGLAISLLMMFIYFIGFISYTYKKHIIRNSVLIGILLTIILLIIFLLYLPNKGSFDEMFFEVGSYTFSLRTKIWNFVGSLMGESPIYIIFGKGFNIVDQFIPLFESTAVNTHNIYVEVFAHGGIILLCAFAFSLYYVFYLLFKKYKQEKSITFIVALGFVMLMLYWFFEG